MQEAGSRAVLGIAALTALRGEQSPSSVPVTMTPFAWSRDSHSLWIFSLMVVITCSQTLGVHALEFVQEVDAGQTVSKRDLRCALFSGRENLPGEEVKS